MSGALEEFTEAMHFAAREMRALVLAVKYPSTPAIIASQRRRRA
jgi:hypothetical protein